MNIKNIEYNFKEMGRRMHTRRKEMKMTQAKLSEITGISPSQISFAENGNRGLSIEALVAICDALKATPDYFLLGCLHPINRPENILDTITLLRAEEVEYVLQFANAMIEKNKEGNIKNKYLENL